MFVLGTGGHPSSVAEGLCRVLLSRIPGNESLLSASSGSLPPPLRVFYTSPHARCGGYSPALRPRTPFPNWLPAMTAVAVGCARPNPRCCASSVSCYGVNTRPGGPAFTPHPPATPPRGAFTVCPHPPTLVGAGRPV